MTTSISPAGPSTASRSGGRRTLICAALDDATVLQMLVDDLVDVGLVDVRVPDLLRVDDDHRTLVTAVEAPCLVHAHLALAGEAQRLDAVLGVVAHLVGLVVLAAGLAGARWLQQKKTWCL